MSKTMNVYTCVFDWVAEQGHRAGFVVAVQAPDPATASGGAALSVINTQEDPDASLDDLILVAMFEGDLTSKHIKRF